MALTDKSKKTDVIKKNWSTAQTAALKTMESVMSPVKVTPPPKGKNSNICWDSSQEKPSFNLSSKQVENMPEAKPGDTVKIVMECTVRRVELNEDKSSDYRLDVDKIAIA